MMMVQNIEPLLVFHDLTLNNGLEDDNQMKYKYIFLMYTYMNLLQDKISAIC